MTAFLALPLGATAILVLYLLKTPRRVLLGIFYGTLVFAFLVNIVEWTVGVRAFYIAEIYRLDNFTRFFSEIFIFVTGLGGVSLFSVEDSSTGSRNIVVPERSGAESKDMPITPSLGHSVTSSDTEIISALLLLATFAMALVSASTSVISLFLSMEFLAIAFYELVALKKNKIGMEAAIKFFVVGVFASLLFLLGAAFYYGVLGTTNFSALASARFSPFFISALVLMLAGIGFKMSIFPLNWWLPDVYQGAPGSITAILAAAAKKAGFAAYIRLFLPLSLPLLRLGHFRASWSLFFGLIAASTMLFGAIVAAMQQNVKRLIAYSIISHAGFIAIGLAAGTRFGYRAALLHIVIHALMALGVFIMIDELEKRGVSELDDYNGIAKKNPVFGGIFVVFLASLTGIPPLAGFLSKFLLWTAAVDAHMIWLAIVAALTSIISAYFYFIIVRRMYGFEPTEKPLDLRLSLLQFTAFALPTILLILFGIFPQKLLTTIAAIL